MKDREQCSSLYHHAYMYIEIYQITQLLVIVIYQLSKMCQNNHYLGMCHDYNVYEYETLYIFPFLRGTCMSVKKKSEIT